MKMRGEFGGRKYTIKLHKKEKRRKIIDRLVKKKSTILLWRTGEKVTWQRIEKI